MLENSLTQSLQSAEISTEANEKWMHVRAWKSYKREQTVFFVWQHELTQQSKSIAASASSNKHVPELLLPVKELTGRGQVVRAEEGKKHDFRELFDGAVT